MLAARAGWALVALAALLIYVLDFSSRSTIVLDFATVNGPAFATRGLSPDGVRLYVLALDVITMVAFSIAAFVVVARKTDDWGVVFISLSLFVFGASSDYLYSLIRYEQAAKATATLLLAINPICISVLRPLSGQPSRGVALAHVMMLAIVSLSQLLIPLAFVIAIFR